jgi:hypothetical protein
LGNATTHGPGGGTLAQMRTAPALRFPGWLLMMLLPWMAAAQSPAPAAPGAQASTVPAQPEQTYSNSELRLTFSYPAELKPMDPGTLPGAARNSVFGDDPDAEAGTLLSGRCAHVLLSVGRVADAQHGGVWGSILLTAIDPGCIPPKTLKSPKAMDKLLTPAVAEGTQILGMVPAGSQVAYPIEGYKVHMAQSQGQPVAKSDLQPADAKQSIAVLAVQVNDRILSWKIESNDTSLFNQMLASHVDFGAGTPQFLSPVQLRGNGPGSFQ